MKKIGLLSDTHAYLDLEILDFFKDVDEIWHAGDIGSEEVLDRLEKFKPVRAVFGNIDDNKIKQRTHENLRFKVEDTDILMTHIGGYPGNYSAQIKAEVFNNPPKLFIAGHSHILKVIFDKSLNFLHINPGAAGKYGWHKVITAVSFEIEGEKIQNMQVFEKQRK